MLYLWIGGFQFTYDGYNIKSNKSVYFAIMDVMVDCLTQVLLFLPVYGLNRVSQEVTTACLYLNEYYHLTLLRNDVNIPVS